MREFWRFWSTDPLFRSNGRRRRSTMLPACLIVLVVTVVVGEWIIAALVALVIAIMALASWLDLRREISLRHASDGRARWAVLKDVLLAREPTPEPDE